MAEQTFKAKIERALDVIKRMKETAPGETICLTFEDVAAVLYYFGTTKERT